MNPYVSDILTQPDDLRLAIAGFDDRALADLARRVQKGEFDRIVLTGMGSSLYACHPIWLLLIEAGLPAWMVDTAEQLHYARGLITPKTLLWAISQSGESAEIVVLLEALQTCRPACVLVTTNNLESSIARMADVVIPLRVREEYNITTRTYVNTLALGQLTALTLLGRDLSGPKKDLEQTSHAMDVYLSQWETRVAEWEQVLPAPERLIVVGRGTSLAAVEAGALVLKEVVRMNVEGQGAAEFRHGPIELADDRLGLLVFEGIGPGVTLNRNLAYELKSLGAKVVWLAAEADPELPSVTLPIAFGIGLPCAEIIPLELLSVQLARAAGIEPGEFRHSGKITATE